MSHGGSSNTSSGSSGSYKSTSAVIKSSSPTTSSSQYQTAELSSKGQTFTYTSGARAGEVVDLGGGSSGTLTPAPNISTASGPAYAPPPSAPVSRTTLAPLIEPLNPIQSFSPGKFVVNSQGVVSFKPASTPAPALNVSTASGPAYAPPPIMIKEVGVLDSINIFTKEKLTGPIGQGIYSITGLTPESTGSAFGKYVPPTYPLRATEYLGLTPQGFSKQQQDFYSGIATGAIIQVRDKPYTTGLTFLAGYGLGASIPLIGKFAYAGSEAVIGATATARATAVVKPVVAIGEVALIGAVTAPTAIKSYTEPAFEKKG